MDMMLKELRIDLNALKKRYRCIAKRSRSF